MQPNIIFIYIDDMGWKDLGCYGSDFYETPNIDKLAGEGMRFTQAYATCPVCSPSRASVMTGKYPASVGITDFINWELRDGKRDFAHRGRLMDVPYLRRLPKEEKTIAVALKEGGYAAWHVGKWHLGDEGALPDDLGFDVNIGGGPIGCPVNGYFGPYKLPGVPDFEAKKEGEFLTDRLTDEAIGLIRNHCNKGSSQPNDDSQSKNCSQSSGDSQPNNNSQPFFLNLWYYAVHTPIQGKKEDIQRFEEKAKRLKLDQVDPIVEGEYFPFEAYKNAKVERRVLQSNPVYAALIYNLDQNIGKLVNAVKEAGQEDNTLVVFTSDNGGLSTADSSPTCNFPLAEGKGWMYDGGVREPLIVKWPGKIPAGTVSDEITTCTDFYPTFLEAAGLPLSPEQHTDGISILPVLTNSEKLDREAIFWHYPHYGNMGGTPGCSVRSGEYKLIEFFEDGRLELYNLTDDISETINLADRLPEIRDRLYKLLCGWKVSVEAKIPEPNPDYEPTTL